MNGASFVYACVIVVTCVNLNVIWTRTIENGIGINPQGKWLIRRGNRNIFVNDISRELKNEELDNKSNFITNMEHRDIEKEEIEISPTDGTCQHIFHCFQYCEREFKTEWGACEKGLCDCRSGPIQIT